jgi:dsDNA-specific endonuclease/ATPase MutS2
MLGTSVGGGILYIEPAAVVSLNNELAAARAESLAAEEAVLWELSGRLMGVLEDVETVSHAPCCKGFLCCDQWKLSRQL